MGIGFIVIIVAWVLDFKALKAFTSMSSWSAITLVMNLFDSWDFLWDEDGSLGCYFQWRVLDYEIFITLDIATRMLNMMFVLGFKIY